MENERADQKSVDRISNLPQSVICEILSWLPTRESVATCILSRSWRNCWKDLQILNFSTRSFTGTNDLTRFVAFVNWFLLQQHRASVRKLRIYYSTKYGFDDAALKSWVSSAIGSHLEELKLDLLTEELTLTQVRFPSLKTLKMSYCHPNLVMKILPGSPVLESLDLELMRGKISVFKIHSPSLKRLYLFDSTYYQITDLLEIIPPP
ncbi:hypothetical protein PIB30_076245 [Stylosanthes scabra]|uniref:F-box domain-containing protein n=1 Tax=Stylosanthes scabra TaxID=79078 RepID=A0ABU6RQN7_9FABA|nr:hypothetical protein [Stylosanthes scabra]